MDFGGLSVGVSGGDALAEGFEARILISIRLGGDLDRANAEASRMKWQTINGPNRLPVVRSLAPVR